VSIIKNIDDFLKAINKGFGTAQQGREILKEIRGSLDK
jgi:hypothetical protein